MIYCPFCGAVLADTAAGWLCVTDEQVFSVAEIEATP